MVKDNENYCYWDKNIKLHEEKNSVMISWLDSPIILYQCLNKLKVNNKIMSITEWVKWVKEKYVPKKLGYGLSVGCSDDTLERHAIMLDICSKFDACDISKESIKKAKELNKIKGFDNNINCQIMDMNTAKFEKKKYDIVFCGASLHHIANLKYALKQIKKSLKPGGFLIINEYVGPSQFQWSDKQIKIINELLLFLPERYRINVKTKNPKKNAQKPSIQQMNEIDPTEAIKSDYILPLIYKFFKVIERIDYGGNILHMLLDGIIGNFNSNKDEDVLILKLLGYIDNLFVQEKIMKSDHVIIVARK